MALCSFLFLPSQLQAEKRHGGRETGAWHGNGGRHTPSPYSDGLRHFGGDETGDKAAPPPREGPADGDRRSTGAAWIWPLGGDGRVAVWLRPPHGSVRR